MRVFSYCCASFKESSRQAVGAPSLLSPPISTVDFDPAWLEGYDLIYLDLHGEPGAAFWRGDGGIVALTAGQVLQARLGGAVVYAVNCYLADDGAPMMDALLDAGARYVIGGKGENWAYTRRPAGAVWLGWRVRQLMERGVDPLRALAMGKRLLLLHRAARRVLSLGRQERKMLGSKTPREIVADTLEFRAYERR